MKNMKEILREIDSKRTLIMKLLVWISPITDDLEYRVAYFSDNMEAMTWENRMKEEYKNLGLSHKVYTKHVVKGEER